MNLIGLEHEKIIAKVAEPTKWVSSFVVVEKPNKLRICLDPQDRNRALQRSHYPFPVIQQILPDLTNAKVFSVVDAKDGFWHVPLDYDSSLQGGSSRPKAALLFWFFGDFRCGVLLFMVIHVIYKYKNK